MHLDMEALREDKSKLEVSYDFSGNALLIGYLSPRAVNIYGGIEMIMHGFHQ